MFKKKIRRSPKTPTTKDQVKRGCEHGLLRSGVVVHEDEHLLHKNKSKVYKLQTHGWITRMKYVGLIHEQCMLAYCIPHCFAMLATMVFAGLLEKFTFLFVEFLAMAMQSKNGNGWTWLSQSYAAYTIYWYWYIYIYIFLIYICMYIYISPRQYCWCKKSSYPVN